jgi:hypothetical protein
MWFILQLIQEGYHNWQKFLQTWECLHQTVLCTFWRIRTTLTNYINLLLNNHKEILTKSDEDFRSNNSEHILLAKSIKFGNMFLFLDTFGPYCLNLLNNVITRTIKNVSIKIWPKVASSSIFLPSINFWQFSPLYNCQNKTAVYAD